MWQTPARLLADLRVKRIAFRRRVYPSDASGLSPPQWFGGVWML